VVEAAKLITDVVESNDEGPFNICSGVPVTIRQVAETIADEFGRRDLLRFGSQPKHYNDPAVVVGISNSPSIQ
jgi:nucleoside-diphosphate-sugar epimerase